MGTQTMSGFDDDFGEMVGGKEETGDLTEDPAAEFLAREQEQLGELETELGPLSVSPQKSPVVAVKVREEPITRSGSPRVVRLVRSEHHPGGEVEGDQQAGHGEHGQDLRGSDGANQARNRVGQGVQAL